MAVETREPWPPKTPCRSDVGAGQVRACACSILNRAETHECGTVLSSLIRRMEHVPGLRVHAHRTCLGTYLIFVLLQCIYYDVQIFFVSMPAFLHLTPTGLLTATFHVSESRICLNYSDTHRPVWRGVKNFRWSELGSGACWQGTNDELWID